MSGHLDAEKICPSTVEHDGRTYPCEIEESHDTHRYRVRRDIVGTLGVIEQGAEITWVDRASGKPG